MHLGFMLLMRAASITWANGRGLGPGNRDFFWPCENGIEPIGECHLGPKKVELGFIRKVNTCFPQGGGGFEV